MSQRTESVKRSKGTPSIDRERLRALRLAADLTAAELAERANCTREYVSLLEIGQRVNPSLGVVAALAEALGCQITDLMPSKPNGGRAA